MGVLEFVALLPMRGDSERVPGKNLRSLCGKPLFFWVLETLQGVSRLDRIVINTDSERIAGLASQHFDVTIHPRPPAIQGGEVSMNRVIADDLGRLPDKEHFLQTHATNPLLQAATLERALDLYEEGLERHDSVFSVTRHQTRFYDGQGQPVNHDPARLVRTQDLPAFYEENSNFYLFSRRSFEERAHRIGARPRMLPMDPLEAVDIDDESDWTLAEVLMPHRDRLLSGRAV